MNWDVFWDCITEINNLPNKLIMKNQSKLKLKLPKDTKIFEEIISDFKNENPNINFNIEYN